MIVLTRFSQRIFYTMHKNWYKICSVGIRDSDVITSYVCLQIKELESGINNGKWTTFAFFLRSKKKFVFFVYMKKDLSRYLSIYNLINFTIFFVNQIFEVKTITLWVRVAYTC